MSTIQISSFIVRMSREDLIALERCGILTGFNRNYGSKVSLRLMKDESAVRVVSSAGREYSIEREGDEYVLREEL